MLRIKIKQIIMLICIAGLCGCVQRTYTNKSYEIGDWVVYDVRVDSNSFLADSQGQNLNGVFGDGAYFGVGSIESEINTMAIKAVADAMKSPVFELLRGGL